MCHGHEEAAKAGAEADTYNQKGIYIDGLVHKWQHVAGFYAFGRECVYLVQAIEPSQRALPLSLQAHY